MNSTTQPTTTEASVRLTSDGLTPEEKHKQVIFAVSLGVAVLAFLLITIGHAAITHMRAKRR